ncbi:MAG: hypothetical protein WCN64_04915 [Planctomycetota bacterium]
MVLWQGTPLITTLGSKYRFALQNHLVFDFKSELKVKGRGAKVASLPKEYI